MAPTDSVAVAAVDTRMRLEAMHSDGLPESIVNQMDRAGAFDCLIPTWERVGLTHALILDVLAMPVDFDHPEKGFDLRFVVPGPLDPRMVAAVSRSGGPTLSPGDTVNVALMQAAAEKDIRVCIREVPVNTICGAHQKKLYGCVFINLRLIVPMNTVDPSEDGGQLTECEPWLSRRVTKHGLSETRADTPFARCPTCKTVYATESSGVAKFMPSKCRCSNAPVPSATPTRPSHSARASASGKELEE